MIYCDCESCDYNDDGTCGAERVMISEDGECWSRVDKIEYEEEE